ncbi:MAG: DUF2442 domain-containing protein [Verrucomicrobia bacterium]|nr:DUF2442 domain-containing protein [Verrucomicrobiota bacterium]
MHTVTKAKALSNFRLRVTFADGFAAEVDLKDHVLASDWPIVDPLKQPAFFRRVRVKNGSVVWPNEYDICPDVLRFWCEKGRASSQPETDAHFASEERMAA